MFDIRAKTKVEDKYFTEKSRDNNLNALRDLKNHRGWKLIADFLNISANELSEKILLVKDDYSFDEKDREILGLFRWLRDLPDNLLREFGGDKDEPRIPDHDPYDKPDNNPV